LQQLSGGITLGSEEGRDYTKRPLTAEEQEDHDFEIHYMQMAALGDERYL